LAVRPSIHVTKGELSMRQRVGLTICCLLVSLSWHGVRATESLQFAVARLTAPPAIKTQSGFSAQLILPPGQRDDPLVMRPAGQVMWLNDDRGQEDDKGSRLLAVDARGGIRALADMGKLLPSVGYDIAPAGFGAYGGQVFSIAQPKVAMEGARANPIIQRIEPARDHATSVFCSLPEVGLWQVPVPLTQALHADGKIYRLTAGGKSVWVATGFHNPMGVLFLHGRLRVSDINGDVIAGKRELPDGFLVEMQAA
jgi:hypothetical protein